MIRAAIIAAAALAVAACQPAPAEPAKPQPQVQRRGANTALPSPEREMQGVEAFTDPATGCEYLVLWDKAITPRFEYGGYNSHGSDLTRVRGCRQ